MLSFYRIKKEVRSTEANCVTNSQQPGEWQSSALVSPTKTLHTDLAPFGDDIEPIAT